MEKTAALNMFGSRRKAEYAHEIGKHCKCSSGREVPSARWGKIGSIGTGEVQQGNRERDGATLHFVKQVASYSYGFCLLYVLIQFI